MPISSTHPLLLGALGRFEDGALLLMRLVTGAFLVWGVQDNLVSAERMHEFEQFLAKFGFAAPAFMARLSVWAQFLVGVAPVPGVAGTLGSAPSSDQALVNLNTADRATLETLPGVGPVTAESILVWREQHGGFTSVDELLEVDGIGDATLADLAPLVTL